MLANAIKFTDRDGKINIKAEIISQGESKQQVKITVADNGYGIKPEDQPKLFKLFGCVKDQKQNINTNGIGLGLVISKLIVNKFDGKISFKSEYQ